MTRILSWGAAFLLAGCAAAGVRITEDQVRQFEREKSTYAEVISKLGPPTSTMATAGGLRYVSYAYMEAAARPETFIPIVGAFVGGADARSNVVTFTFNQQDVMVDYLVASSQVGTGLGANVEPVDSQRRKN